MVTLATYFSVDEALLARSRLEDAGLEAFVPDENCNTSLASPVGGARLMVTEEDVPLARQLLELPPAGQP
jgi:hypothetical protein